ncbi:hypothetical protein [Microbulbifer sp. YPW16]|uniref:hypothetical protein n=1 Tax=Microbulbifer sp. YPW16 TaxID=2904242 RepID=UPI001E3DF110|nr:hypothetical protein [Microbulbifer sp. YPW16]UHQ57042.1 hypothetical protein LVE68_08700 [Microbulbifer sp. YPW16]
MFHRTLALLVIFSSFVLSACSAQHNLGEETWYQVDSTNFRIVTNGDPEAVETLARDLERYRAVALKLLGTQGARQEQHKLTIYATADRQTYAGLVGPELAEMTNGLFDTTAQGSYALVNLDGRTGERQLQAREFLFHEYTHFLSYNRNTTHYPYWYSEGFAEFMSTMTFPTPGRYKLGAVPEERAMTLIYTSPMPLEELLRATVINTPDEEKPRVYASGWMLAHWLIMESGKVDQFRDYVRAYNNGADPVESLTSTFGVKLEDVQERYAQLFQEGEFEMVSGIVPKEFREVSPGVQQLSPQRAIAEVGHFLVLSGYNLGGLGSLLQYAHANGLMSAELISVQADAETRMGNYEAAEELLASVPLQDRSQFRYQNVDAWLGLTRQANTPGAERDREELKKVRDKFVYLVNNDEDTASHWYGLAMSMQMLDYPQEKYLEMLEQAYLRAPRQVHIAQWLAQELYNKRDAEYFARVAQPLLMELDDEEQHQQMKLMLAEMKAEQEPGVKARVNKTLASKERSGNENNEG